MKTPTLAELEAKKQDLQDQLNLVYKAINDKLSHTLVRCGNIDCLRGWEIRELTYIDQQTHEEECGYGGSYRTWHEGQWICPKCQCRNRLYDKPEIEKLSHLFKDTEIVNINK
jgi:hypothetical protein